MEKFLVHNSYLSADPAMRGWIADKSTYWPRIEVGDTMRAFAAGEVVEIAQSCLCRRRQGHGHLRLARLLRGQAVPSDAQGPGNRSATFAVAGHTGGLMGSPHISACWKFAGRRRGRPLWFRRRRAVLAPPSGRSQRSKGVARSGSLADPRRFGSVSSISAMTAPSIIRQLKTLTKRWQSAVQMGSTHFSTTRRARSMMPSFAGSI